ncbi:hypothetical protein GE856_25345 [Salmonella enterica]|nr:hypothetical protein [Salmonella enterica]EEK4519701.1 hypothetical protein [Salmonella enterica]EIP9519772.1 hypothetical protein [Salmonella enterica]
MIPVDTQKLSYSAVVKQGITSPVSRNTYSQRSITRHIQSIRNSSNNIFPDKVRNHGYTFVLSEQNISGNANKSIIELYKNKKKTLPDVLKLTTALIQKSNTPEVAFHLVENLKKSGITPNRITYNAYMHCLANAGNPEQAREMLDKMRDMGLTPNVISYNTLMNAWANAGDPEQAQKVLDEMRDKGLTPDVISYTTLMNAWANAGDPEQAQKVLDEMRDKGLPPDVTSYSTLMNAWEKANIPEFATDNGYHNYILPLIKNATGDGVFGEKVGYDKRKNVIDFHLSKLLLSSKEDGGTTAAWARAIVNFHYHEGNLESNPLLIVGRHGSGAVREAVLSELRALSDNYGKIFNYVVDPLNPGRLIVEKLVKKPVNNSV